MSGRFPTSLKAGFLDVGVAGFIAVAWLSVPAYLDSISLPATLVFQVISIELPLVIASAFIWDFVLRRKLASRSASGGGPDDGKLLFYGFMAYFWSLADDAPIGLDTVFTWPRTNSGPGHTFMELLLHALTLLFMYLTVREALGGVRLTRGSAFKVLLLVVLAFWLSYFQNTPLPIVNEWTNAEWYRLNVVEHLFSLVFLFLAVRECTTAKAARPPEHRPQTGMPRKNDDFMKSADFKYDAASEEAIVQISRVSCPQS